MYKNQSAPKKWIDPTRRAELQERDRIRQAYYVRLEKEKQGIVEDASPVVLQPQSEIQIVQFEEVIAPVEEKLPAKTAKKQAVKETGLKRKKAKE